MENKDDISMSQISQEKNGSDKEKESTEIKNDDICWVLINGIKYEPPFKVQELIDAGFVYDIWRQPIEWEKIEPGKTWGVDITRDTEDFGNEEQIFIKIQNKTDHVESAQNLDVVLIKADSLSWAWGHEGHVFEGPGGVGWTWSEEEGPGGLIDWKYNSWTKDQVREALGDPDQEQDGLEENIEYWVYGEYTYDPHEGDRYLIIGFLDETVDHIEVANYQ
ncbi:MAG: hypothetical protein Q4F78_08820 [Bacillota bacterium]|nr:hypothetical protein [Bacillota bacterium]